MVLSGYRYPPKLSERVRCPDMPISKKEPFLCRLLACGDVPLTETSDTALARLGKKIVGDSSEPTERLKL